MKRDVHKGIKGAPLNALVNILREIETLIVVPTKYTSPGQEPVHSVHQDDASESDPQTSLRWRCGLMPCELLECQIALYCDR